MGRYSTDSDDDYKKAKKKKKRSRSYSSDDSRKRSKKSKKIKKKSRRHSRSRSRSSERSRRRRRSYSRERRKYSRSRSRSRGRRSRSRSSTFSRSRYRRSRSRNSSVSRSRRRSGSRSRRNTRSRSGSRSRSRRNRSRSRSLDPKKEKAALENVDPCLSIPGFQEMSLPEQNEVRMKMAIKAAAATDAKLREQGLLPSNVGIKPEVLSFEQQQDRAKNIQDIEAGAFVQQDFTSSRSQPKQAAHSVDSSHESAIFSATSTIENLTKNIVYKNRDSLLGPIFYESVDAKWDRWIAKVAEFRRKRLEGEAIS